MEEKEVAGEVAAGPRGIQTDSVLRVRGKVVYMEALDQLCQLKCYHHSWEYEFVSTERES